MRKLRTIIMITLLLLSVLAAGCIGGDGDSSDDADDEPELFEGSLSDLKITLTELPDGYELMGEETVDNTEDLEEIDEDLLEYGFEEGYIITYMYLSEDFSDMGLVAEMIIKFSADDIEDVLDTFKEKQLEELGGSATYESISNIGDSALKITAYEDESELELYQIVFVKKDLLVAIVATGADDSETLADTLAGYVDSLI